MGVLLGRQFDASGLLVADADLQAASFGGDAEVAVAESADEIERLARRLLVREAHRVGGDVFLDGFTYVRRGAEEAVGGNEPFERLMRTLEVVGVHEELDASVAVREVREDGAREELVPERLPEALDLAERLRMLRPALDVIDAVQVQLALEVRLAAPCRVLAALVGENLSRLSVGGDAALERFHHELGLLMVREVVRDDEARVVVHERREVEALVTAKQEREDVRLPHLVWRGALEATRRMLARPSRRTLLDEPGLVEDAANGGLGHADPLEAREQVTDAAGAELGILLTHGDDVLALNVVQHRRTLLLDAHARLGP